MSDDDRDDVHAHARARLAEIRSVEALEVALLDPAVRSDPDRLDQLLHPDFVEHGASGRIWTRQEIVDELPLEDDTTPPTTASDLVAQHLTDDVIVVTYRTMSTLKTAVRSSVWVRSTDGTWTMRFHQGTVVPEADNSAAPAIREPR